MEKDASMMSVRVAMNKNSRQSIEAERVRAWLAVVLDERVEEDVPLEELLHNGVLLCRLINRIHPDAIPCINSPNSGMFLLRDNVDTFLKKCTEVLGLQSTVLFDVADLFEARNMMRVYGTLHAVSISKEAQAAGIPPLNLNLGTRDDDEYNQKLILSADTDTIIQSIRNRLSNHENPRGLSTLHEAACFAEFAKAIDPIITEKKKIQMSVIGMDSLHFIMLLKNR